MLQELRSLYFFKSLMVTQTSAVPPEMRYCFWSTILIRWGCSIGFHLPFSTIMAPIPWIRESFWEFCQLGRFSITTLHFRPWEDLQSGYRDILCLLGDESELKVYWSLDIHELLHWLVDNSSFDFVRISMSLELMSSNHPPALAISSFLMYSYPDKCIQSIHFWLFSRVLPQVDQPSLHSRSSGVWTGSNIELVEVL